MKRPLLFTLFLCLIFGASLAGCGGSSKPTVAFVTNNAAEFWSYAEAGCRKAEKEFGVPVEFRRPQTDTAAAQKEIIDGLRDKGVQAIAVSVIDPKNQTRYLKQIASSVKMLTQDNDAPESGRLCYIGTDNIKAGRAVGKLVKKAMPEGGIIAIFVGRMESLNAQQRSKGVLDELAGPDGPHGKEEGEFRIYGKYKLFSSGSVHGIFTDNTKQDKARKNAEFVLNRFPKEKNLCLIGLWAYNPPMIYAAVRGQGRQGKVKIAGMDEAKQTLAGIADGHIVGTVAQQPYVFGYESVKIMAHLIKGDNSLLPKDEIMYITHIVVTKEADMTADGDIIKLQEKVGDFQRKLEKMINP